MNLNEIWMEFWFRRCVSNWNRKSVLSLGISTEKRTELVEYTTDTVMVQRWTGGAGEPRVCAMKNSELTDTNCLELNWNRTVEEPNEYRRMSLGLGTEGNREEEIVLHTDNFMGEENQFSRRRRFQKGGEFPWWWWFSCSTPRSTVVLGGGCEWGRVEALLLE